MRHAFFCAHLRRIQQTTRLLHRHVFRLAYGNLGAIDRRREPRPDTSQPGATFSTGSMIFRGLVHHEVARVETWTPAQTTCSDSSTDVLEQPLVSAPGPRSRSCCRDLRRHLSNPEAFADRLAAGTCPTSASRPWWRAVRPPWLWPPWPPNPAGITICCPRLPTEPFVISMVFTDT